VVLAGFDESGGNIPHPHHVALPSFGQVAGLHIFKFCCRSGRIVGWREEPRLNAETRE